MDFNDFQWNPKRNSSRFCPETIRKHRSSEQVSGQNSQVLLRNLSQDLTSDQEKLESFAREVVELFSQEVRRLYADHGGIFGVDIPADFWKRRPVP